MTKKIVGIIGAMPEEIKGVIQLLSDKEEIYVGGRTFYHGYINYIEVVVVISGWGKVSAAVAITTLIQTFNISEVIFTGVGGAINKDLHIGDIVIGKRLVQHDMDVRPLIPQFQIPSLGKIYVETNGLQLEKAIACVQIVLDNLNLEEIQEFCVKKPVLYVGDIASGDQFFSSNKQKEKLLKELPTVLCVEMEGAAVAQVCCEYSIPFTVIRTISDQADESSSVDFNAFIKQIASRYSVEIITNLIK